MAIFCLILVFLTTYVESVKKSPLGIDLYDLPKNGYNSRDNVYIQSKNSIRISSPDDDNYIERPCNVYDINCIRKFFAEHSRCKITYGLVPDPLYRPTFTLYLPRINLTLTSLKVEYNGLNGQITEFYINRKTDKLVLAVEFDGFRFNSNDNYFQFHRVGRESLVTNDFFNVSYTSIGSTITIPHLKDLKLQASEVYSYSVNPELPMFAVGLRVFGDPRLLPTAVAFLADLGSNILEGFLQESTFFISSFIQYYLCDFGATVP